MLDTYDYTNCFEKENEELAVTTLKDNIKEKLFDIPAMPPQQSDDERQKTKRLKILASNRLLTRLLVLLAQILMLEITHVN